MAVATLTLPVVLDPVTDDPTAAELDINDGRGYVMGAEPDLTPPAAKPVYVSSFATEGSIPASEAHYENRELGLPIRVYGSDEDDLENKLAAVYQKVGKINREGGVLAMTFAAGTVRYFDLLPEASGGARFDAMYLKNFRCDLDLRLAARPFWRGPEIAYDTVSAPANSNATPACVFTVSDIPGDALALGRLVIHNNQGADWWTVYAGMQSRYYNPAPTHNLVLLGSDLTPLGTSTKVLSIIRNTDLTPTFQALLKSELDVSNFALQHKGQFRVVARLGRPSSNTGAVSVRLEWGQWRAGSRAINTPVTFAVNEREGGDTATDLGVVTIDPDWPFWEFRVAAKSTVTGDEIDVKDILLFPADEAFIRMSARYQSEATTAHSAGTGVDDATVGTIAWSTPGNVTASDNTFADAAIQPNGAISHYLKATNFGFSIPSSAAIRGIKVEIERHNEQDLGIADSSVKTVKGGTIQGANQASGALWPYSLGGDAYASYGSETDVWGTSWTPADINASNFGVAISAQNVGAGSLAAARVDHIRITVYYSEFPDAAMFANQTVEWSHDGARRTDPAGIALADVSVREGGYLKIPPAGRENRKARFLVKGYRDDIDTDVDPTIDATFATLYVTPRGLVVPAA